MIDLKFYYQPFKKGTYWSKASQKYFISDDIGNQVWLHKGSPVKGELLTLYDIVRKLPVNVPKKERSLVLRFNTESFPVQESVGYDKWNGIIFIDLDMIHSKTFCDKIECKKDDKSNIIYFNEERNNQFFEALKNILSNILPENFYMIEHSSSKIGLHIMFYYDCERTEDNFFKYANYTKEILFNKIHNNDYAIIKDFDKIISEYEGESVHKQKVFDDIWKRAYQKCFITGIDLYINDFTTGKLPQNYTYVREKIKEDNTSYEITSFNIDKKKIWLTDHNDRFYLYTALKKATSSKEELDSYWKEICKHFKLYKDYTYNKFIKEFNYNEIKSEKGNVKLLERYGIKIDKSKIEIRLSDNQFLGDYREKLISMLDINGIYFWRAPTGSGKTRFWVDFNRDILNDVIQANNHKPILVVEPLNSIIDTKYRGEDVECIFGNRHFPKQLTGYSMYITNYNKLLKKDIGERYSMRDDIDEFLSKFSMIVIDESHIILKDSFRSEVLIPFIESIKKASKSSKIILQTATPMDEELLFDIEKYITIYKKPKNKAKYIFRRFNGDVFNIQDITCLVQYYISSGKKVYIYWNNAALSQLESFRATFEQSDKVAIYHKRNMKDISMQRISKYHVLDTRYYFDNKDLDFEEYHYDVLLSSVYFGVGNDLNDICDAAVIIIGNNTWQEDIQANGRWRNCKSLEICQIILPSEYEYIKFSADNEVSRKDYLDNWTKKLYRIWNDKLSKDKSVIINHKAYMIQKESDIKYLAIMKSAEDYYSSFLVKCNAFIDEYYDYDVRPNYDKYLECNYDYTELNKAYWKSIQNIRDKVKKEIIQGKIEYENIDKDSKLESWYKLFKRLEKYDLVRKLGADYVCKSSNQKMLEVFEDYYKRLKSRNIDYPELYSLLWYRDRYDKNNEKKKKILDKEIYENEWYIILAYIIFIHNKNKKVKDYKIQSIYYSNFRFNCKMFCKMNDILVNMFYETKTESETDISQSKIFFAEEWKDEEFEDIIIHSIDDILSQTDHIDNSKKEIISVVKNCIEYSDSKSKGGKTTKNKKKIEVINKFKHAEKYKLSVGMTFDSCQELAEYTNKTFKTVSSWLSKGWIKNIS